MKTKKERPFSVNKKEYPFKDRWLMREGTAMHYIDEGKGKAVLLLHGNPTWSFLYRNIIKGLKGRCRTIAPDYPGFGFSDHPPDYGYMPQEHAGWVNALIDHLKLKKIILVLQDWGGPIGLSIAVKRPKIISGLLILNTWCWPADTMARIFSFLMGGAFPGKYLQLQRNFFARKIVPGGIFYREKLTPEILDAYTGPFPTPASRMGTWVFPGAITKAGAWLEEIEKGLPLLREKPVEMIWAMKDQAFGKEDYINRWLKYFPEAPVKRLQDASHYLQEDRPDLIIAAIQRLLRKAGRS